MPVLLLMLLFFPDIWACCCGTKDQGSAIGAFALQTNFSGRLPVADELRPGRGVGKVGHNDTRPKATAVNNVQVELIKNKALDDVDFYDWQVK